MKLQSEWTNIDYMEEGRRQERRDLIEWLNGTCDGHVSYVGCDDDNGGNQLVLSNCKRKDCSLCWAKLQPSGLSKLMGKFPDL